MSSIRRTALLAVCLFSACSSTSNVAPATKDMTLANASIAAHWTVSGNRISGKIEDRWNKTTIDIPPTLFAITLADGTTIDATNLRLTKPPAISPLAADEKASRLSNRLTGQQFTATFAGASVDVEWRAILRNDSHYLRQELTITATGADVPIRNVRLLDLDAKDAHVVGEVKGSPVVAGRWFFGFEHPLSQCSADGSHLSCGMSRELPLRAGHTIDVSSVIGISREGQLRRDFLAYVERERAHPYRTFLHYNSWYDLGYFTKFDEAGALDRINAFGTELHDRRGVTLDSYLFDDGWDDPTTLWRFHAGFPRGFTPLRDAAARYGAAPGVWLSPWGGYGKPHEERMKYGKEAGFEMNAKGFALSGPEYFRRFQDVCMQMIRDYGVNQFKIDGTGNVNSAIPGSEFDSDFAAAIRLIDDLRAAKPDVYINLTTGTYPSPFWLRYADSIWRGGEDHDFAGVGSWRQRWITYRDADTYAGVVKAGPLYPINSLMLHGLIYAQHAKDLTDDPLNDFGDEIHSYFATGTQLQEMYITPSLLSQANWDDLAEAAKWSRRNAGTLVDNHWIGGDPAKLEVYGWAAWSPHLGIVTLRNPSDKPQTYVLDLQKALELPPGAPRSFDVKNVWKNQSTGMPANADLPHTISLRPFQVMTFELTPR